MQQRIIVNMRKRRRELIWGILGICLCLPGFGHAQVEVSHQSDFFYIEPGTEVHIQGSLISLSGNSDPLSNLGEMYISDSVSCYGDNRIFGPTPDTSTAEVFLDGTHLQTFTGTTPMRFGKLTIRNAYDSLRLVNRVEVFSRLQIDFGNIDVDNDTLDLLHTGYIQGEVAEDRIFTDDYGRIHLNRPLLLGTNYGDIAGIGLGLQIDGNLGSGVDIYRGNFVQPNISNGSIERVYEFAPQLNGDVSHPVSRYLDSTELAGNDENRLQFFRSSTSGVNWDLAGGTADTLTDIVDGGSSLAFTMTTSTAITLAEGECDSLPEISFPQDTIPICGTATQAWLVPQGTIGNLSAWSNGAMNQDSIQVSTAGTYRVLITDVKGCKNEDSVVVVNAPAPVADFQVTPVCIGDSSQFQNQSTLTAGSLSYFWDLNDIYTAALDTSSQSAPGIVYSNPGTYTVTLLAESQLGCTDTFVSGAIVLPYPVADFAAVDACADSVLQLVNNSSVTPNAPMQFVWDFGNGDSATAAVPAYGFPNSGAQQVTLTTTSNGCSSSTTQNVSIFPNPVADFSAPAVCLGQASSLTNASSISSGSLSYVWQLAPGTSSLLTNPTYTYASSGSQAVTLTATSADGCSDDTTLSVLVNALPQPSFAAVPTCQGSVMQFNNTSPASSGFQWNFNQEGQSNLYSPQFTFTSAGTKSIVLIETDINGCVDSIQQAVISKPAPVAAFSINGNCEGAPISFLNSSSTPAGTMSFQWNFGDQNTSTQNSPTHVYQADGNFPVQLVAENDGCFDTLTLPLAIDSMPWLNLGSNIATCDSQYIFDAGNPGSTYLWSNGSTTQAITALFNGSYHVLVTNGAGCTNTDTVSLILNSIVKPNLGPDSSFCDVAVLDAGYPGSVYQWSTGASSQSIQPNQSGTYSVTVTDQNGCVGSDTIAANIVVGTVPDLGPDLSLCEGVLQVLDPQQIGVTYTWSSGDTTAQIQVDQSGTYSLLLVDANGCEGRDTVNVLFNPLPLVDLGPDSSYCDSLRFDFSQPHVSFQWSTGGNAGTETLTQSGTYNVLLTDTLSACQNSDTVTISLFDSPIVDLGLDTVLCSGANLQLDAGNPGASYVWNIGDTTAQIAAASSGIYAVQVMSAAGCTGTDSILVSVNAPISTDLGSDFTLCQGEEVVVSSPIFGGQYTWSLDGNLLSNTDQSLLISAFGTYVVEVLDASGCYATDTVVALQTGSEINAEFLVSTVNLFAGDTLQFVNLSFPEPFSSYWSFGDGAFSIDEDPRHSYLVPGDYEAILSVTNGVCTDTLLKNLTIVPKVVEPVEVAPGIVLNDFVSTQLYPNPNDGNFTVRIELVEEGQLKIQCVDMYGHVLLSGEEWGQEFELEFANLDLAVGMYLLNLRVSGRSQTIRFVKE